VRRDGSTGSLRSAPVIGATCAAGTPPQRVCVRRRVGNEAAMYIGIGALILIIVILLILLR
jgi:hypothetical protein